MGRMISEGEQAAQLVFPGFKFGVDDPRDAAAWVELGVGGFCLYGGGAREVAEFTAALQKKAKIPLLFSADYEDGVASQSIGATRLPSNMGLGASRDEALACRKGAITAVEARALGVRWVLAPVVDLATQASNPIVNVRAFGSDPKLVSRLARAYIKGLQAEKVLSCLKHFPGHGDTLKDSHLELPSVDVSRAVLLDRELVPYRELAAAAEAVMPGHLLVSALESKKIPISLSKDAVAGVLRGDLNFKGLVSTDALNMHAITHHYGEQEAAELALSAGVDILLVPADPRKLIYGLLSRVGQDAALRAAVKTSWERLHKAKEAAGLYADKGLVGEEEFSRVGCKKHKEASRMMAEACVAWAPAPAAKLPGRVRYMEPDSETPEDWTGVDFVSELRGAGIEVKPQEEGAASETLVVGCFIRPHAYTGRISYEPQWVERVARAISKAKRCILVSFGSPFVFEQFKGFEAGLCAFSGYDESQRAVARVLTGAIAAKGKMPV